MSAQGTFERFLKSNKLQVGGTIEETFHTTGIKFLSPIHNVLEYLYGKGLSSVSFSEANPAFGVEAQLTAVGKFISTSIIYQPKNIKPIRYVNTNDLVRAIRIVIAGVPFVEALNLVSLEGVKAITNKGKILVTLYTFKEIKPRKANILFFSKEDEKWFNENCKARISTKGIINMHENNPLAIRHLAYLLECLLSGLDEAGSLTLTYDYANGLGLINWIPVKFHFYFNEELFSKLAQEDDSFYEKLENFKKSTSR